MKTGLIFFAVIMEIVTIAGGVLKLYHFEQADQILLVGLIMHIVLVILGLWAWYYTTKKPRPRRWNV